MRDDSVEVSLETLLQITRQKLVAATILNTELEAVIADLRKKIEELESKDS